MIWRTSSMPLLEAASISCTSTWRDSAMATQGSQTPQGWMVGSLRVPSGPTQLSARAMMRAVVVLPTPRTPVSMKACAMRPVANAFDSVLTSASLADQAGESPDGRYLRASTR